MSTSSKLRRPNFSLSTATSSRTNGGIVDINSSSAPPSSLPSSSSIAKYTRQCHQKIIASAHATNNTNDADYQNGDQTTNTTDSIGNASGNTNDAMTNDKKRSNDTSNTTTDTTSINTSMEQCITLLEPSLNMFYNACVQNEKKKKKARKKEKKRKEKSSSMGGEEGGDGIKGQHSSEVEGGGDIVQETEDEVPPQLLRLARFFPYRWHPMKKALLRPPPTTFSTDVTNGDKSGGNVVEVGIRYRLRLAKACYKKGLVAGVEYEVLKGAFDQDEERFKQGRRRSRSSSANDNDNDDRNDASKRYKGADNNFNSSVVELGKENHNGNHHTHSLSERVRLSIMRLPTDIASIHSNSNNDQSSVAAASWRHVHEMLLEYCTQWTAKTKKDDEDEDEDDAKNNGEKDGNHNAIVTETTTPATTDLVIVPPQQVADWIMTCWTAILLVSQGMRMDCSSFFLGNNGGATATTSACSNIELQLATLLSDRSQHQQTTSSSKSNQSTYPIAQAVASRIDNLLLPTNIQSLNGIHLYSLGRLLALFHCNEDAEIHIATSIVKCSLMGDGGGGDGATGIMGLEQLSRLLAVYSCCRLSASSASTDCNTEEDLLMMHNMNNDDTFTSSSSKKKKCIMKDLEGRLRANLDETSEVVKRIAMEKEKGDDDNGMSSSSCCLKGISIKAKSFLDVVVGATAHLVQYSVC